MQVLQHPKLDEIATCPYLPGRQKQFEYFFATHLSGRDVSALLAEGWRKFGFYYFRPACPGCRQCIPLRVCTDLFSPSRSQRRVLRKNAHLRVEFGPLRFTDRIFEIYRDHSLARFGQDPDLDEFLSSFYNPSCPSLQSEIYLGQELIGIGFLDRGADCLSSVYFCFDTRYSHLNPGTFSILHEIAHAGRLGLPYYYLGYYVPGCPRMIYKDAFRPREHYDWQGAQWKGGAP